MRVIKNDYIRCYKFCFDIIKKENFQKQIPVLISWGKKRKIKIKSSAFTFDSKSGMTVYVT